MLSKKKNENKAKQEIPPPQEKQQQQQQQQKKQKQKKCMLISFNHFLFHMFSLILFSTEKSNGSIHTKIL